MTRAVPWLGALLLVVAHAVHAQEAPLELKQVERLYLDDVHAAPEGERVVDLYFRALTRHGVPVKGIREADLEVWQDDEQIDLDENAIQPLGRSGQGVTAVLAIDVSGTMRGERFKRARGAALAFLEKLEAQDRLAVVTFAEDVNTIADFDLSREEARQAIRNLEIDLERSQHTLLFDGAHRAIELIRRSRNVPRRSFIILFSDGKDGGSDRSREQVISAAKGRDREPQVLIFSIGYAGFGGGGLDEMRKLAEGTGGDFLEARSVVHLRDFFDAIAIQMTNSYLLRFATGMDGEEHQIRITIEKQTAKKTAAYPEIRGPILPWIAGGAAVLLAIAAFLLFRRGRIVGRVSIVSGPLAGRVIAVRPGKTRIGALEDNEIALPDSDNTVSRYHAEIVARGRSVEISDLRSKNGTRVNGEPVTKAPLRPGDKIHVADIELVFER